MKKGGFIFCFIFLLLTIESKSQSAARSFHSLSYPEKLWVFEHPFVAQKAFKCSQQARFVTDSIEKTGTLKDANGGQLDAFRHAYWMALLVQKISPRKAMKLGRVHENGNQIDFLKGKMEDSLRADSIMCVMDLKNDSAGINIGKKIKADTSANKISLEQTVVNEVKNGKLTMIKKDALGNWQDISGRKIDLKLYEKNWFIPKVLVKSNYIQAPITN